MNKVAAIANFAEFADSGVRDRWKDSAGGRDHESRQGEHNWKVGWEERSPDREHSQQNQERKCKNAPVKSAAVSDPNDSG